MRLTCYLMGCTGSRPLWRRPFPVAVVMTVAEVDAREATEANVRRLMAKRAALPLTWETRAERAELLVEINAGLEHWNRLPI